MIALRNQTVAREFFPSFDSANGCLCQERLLSSRNFATMITYSGRSRPSDKGGGEQSSRPWDKGVGLVSKKKFCQSFGPQFGLKIRAGQPDPSPGSTTDLMSHFSSLWSLDRRGMSTSFNINKTYYDKGVCHINIPLYLQVIEAISLENGI